LVKLFIVINDLYKHILCKFKKKRAGEKPALFFLNPAPTCNLNNAMSQGFFSSRGENANCYLSQKISYYWVDFLLLIALWAFVIRKHP